MKDNFAKQVIKFYDSLNLDVSLPEKVNILNPFSNEEVKEIIKEFYLKFYNNSRKRIFVLGINPGRFGAGVTGVTFTDPINLLKYCKIKNNLIKKHELSSQFIYKVINTYGGVKKFYSKFYLGAVSPIGFVKNGKNINYYDLNNINQIEGFIVENIIKQIGFGAIRKVCICLGEGKNYRLLKNFNEKYGFFEEIIPLPHPRFIMQYKRKKLDDYVKLYIKTFEKYEDAFRT